MPPYGKRCLEAPKQPPFWLELQAKHLQEVAEFERLTQSSWAELRRKQGAELDAAIQLLQTDKIQQHKHQKHNSYDAVPPPSSLTSKELTCDNEGGRASGVYFAVPWYRSGKLADRDRSIDSNLTFPRALGPASPTPVA